MINGYHVNLYAAHVEIELAKEYVRLIEELIEGHENEFLNTLEENAKNMSEDIAEQYWDYNYDNIYNLRDSFPQKLRSTLFISSHSILEVNLNNLCKTTGKHKRVKLNDLYGKGIERARNYLKKVIEVDFPDNSKEWQFIKNCNNIRNIIVHSLGKINVEENRNDEVRDFILKYPNLISLVDYNNKKYQDNQDHGHCAGIYLIALEKEFIPYYLDVLDRFITKLNNIILKNEKELT